MSDNKKYENNRFIGKIRETSGQFGKFLTILLDNINPTNKDNTPNQYYKGNLIWLDQQTGKKYLVKRIAIKGINQNDKGDINSIMLDLGDQYQVQPLD